MSYAHQDCVLTLKLSVIETMSYAHQDWVLTLKLSVIETMSYAHQDWVLTLKLSVIETMSYAHQDWVATLKLRIIADRTRRCGHWLTMSFEYSKLWDVLTQTISNFIKTGLCSSRLYVMCM